MSTQLQIRRDTEAQLTSMTPVAGEPGFVTDLKRMIIGDGATPGGRNIPTDNDLIGQKLTACIAAGSANALVLAFPRPVGAYTLFQRVSFQVSNNNSGPVTLKYSDLGSTKSLRTIAGGVVAELEPDTLVAGRIYSAVYDGTQFILDGSSGSTVVKQSNLSTSIGIISSLFVLSPESLSFYATGGYDFIALPGGEYGFTLQSKDCITGLFWALGYTGSVYVTAAAPMAVKAYCGPSGIAKTIYAQQRYINSSPPFEIGGVEQTGFIFLLKNADGSIASSYVADTPPWGYNGPTKIRADHICPFTKRKYRRVQRPRTVQEIMDGKPCEMVTEEITQAIKNADMKLIPHPFLGKRDDQTVVMIDARENTTVASLIEAQNLGDEDIIRAINSGLIKVNSDPVTNLKKGPLGVHVCKLKK